MIKGKRKSEFFDNYILKLIEEAKNLGITKEELIEMIKNREN